MKKIGIIICGRYHTAAAASVSGPCASGPGLSRPMPEDEAVEVVGFANCGGCPGGNIEYVPAEMKKNGAEDIHLATGLVVGYPPCPNIRKFKEFIETAYGLPVVIGTHPIPLKYLENHQKLPFWKQAKMDEIAAGLLAEDRQVMESYN